MMYEASPFRCTDTSSYTCGRTSHRYTTLIFIDVY